MLVFWAQRLVLLSMPKTATTSLEAALAPRADIIIRNPPDLKHAPTYRYRRFLRPMFDQIAPGADFELMALVREPVSWLSSWYRYRSREELGGHQNSTKGVSFDQFVGEFLSDAPAPYAKVGSQARFLCDEDGSVSVDQLFQYEQLPHAVAFLEDRLSCKLELEKLNVSPSAPVNLDKTLSDRLRAERSSEFRVWASAGRSAS